MSSRIPKMEVTIDNIRFKEVPDKRQGVKIGSILTLSNVKMSESVADYINNPDDRFYTLVNAVDIDWNAVVVDNNLELHTTSDLIKWIKSLAGGGIDPSNYYNKEEIDAKVTELNQADTDINNAIGTDNTPNTVKGRIKSIEDSYVSDNDLSDYTYDKNTIDEKVAQGETFDPEQYYNKQDTDQLLNAKADSNSLSNVATSGSYNDLSGKPTIPDALVQADWNEANTSNKSYIKNKPNIPTVPTNVSAFTNDAGYLTLHLDISGKADKSTLATVATSGSYTDLTDRPTIPDAQIQADWNASSGMGAILNKPTLGDAAAKGVTDNTTATEVTSTDGNLITARTLYNAGYTKNEGTITGIKMNGIVKGTSGVVDLGIVIDDVSSKADKSSTVSNVVYDATNKKITKTINGTESDVVTTAKLKTDMNLTSSDVGLGNVGNFKAVSTVASQDLTSEELINARTNIGAGTSSFSGSYNDLTNKPAIPYADKSYAPSVYSGLGRKNLELKNESNILTQLDFNLANTIYVIQYDFDLNDAEHEHPITIPENCVLEFDGGSLNNGTIVGQNTVINNPLVKAFGDVSLEGTWNVAEVYPEWFGAKGDGSTDDTAAIQKAANTGMVVKLVTNKTYKTTNILFFQNSLDGNGATIKAVEIPPVESDEGNYLKRRALDFADISNFYVTNLNVESAMMGVVIRGCKNFSVKNCNFKTVKFSLSLAGNGTNYCDGFIVDSIHFDNALTDVNSDGLHIFGGVRNGSVSCLTGITGDDFIALNGNEGTSYANESILGIDNINFSSCEMDEECPLGLRIYTWDDSSETQTNHKIISNIQFNNCRFQSTHDSQSGIQETPCVRFAPYVVFLQPTEGSSDDLRRLKANNIVFNNCYFKTHSTNWPTIGICNVDGDVQFNNCTWSDNYVRNAISLHNSHITVNIEGCHLAGGIQGWQWPRNNNGENYITIKDSDVQYFSTSDIALLYFGYQYAHDSKNHILVDNVRMHGHEVVDGLDNVTKHTLGFIGSAERTDKLLDMELTVRNCPNTLMWVAATNAEFKIDKCDRIRIGCGNPTYITGRITISDSITIATNNITFSNNTGTACHFNGNSVVCACPTTNPVKGDIMRMNDIQLDAVYDGSRWKSVVNGVMTTTDRTTNQDKYPVGHQVFDTDLNKTFARTSSGWVEM